MNSVIPIRGMTAAALLVLLAACDGGGTGPEQPGSVQVTVATTGRVLDRDGYSVSVDGGPPVTVQANGSATLPGLTPGAHTVEISGIAGNCTLDGGASRSVTVQENAATPLAVAVQCVADRFAYYQGLGTGVGMGLFVAKTDGTGAVELKRGLSLEFARTDWSPDGHSLLYVRRTSDYTTSVWSVDVFTRDSTLITGEGHSLHPQWSPSGDRIATSYVLVTNVWSPPRINVMNANGSGRHALTGYTGNEYELMPTWSPDGNSIAYRRGAELRIVNVDGTGDRFVTDMGVDSYTEIAWSPDGAWLVWFDWDQATGTTDLFRVHPDGSGRAAITPTAGVWEEAPSFMADGRIVFSSVTQGNFNYDPWAIAVDGSGRTNLLSTPQIVERLPTWQ
jgi:Tol biopolymer transport system component